MFDPLSVFPSCSRPRVMFAVVFVVALTNRLIALVLLGPRVTNDSQIYLAAAHAITSEGMARFLALPLDGRLLYSLLLAAVGGLSGSNIVWSVAVLQGFLGAATALIIGRATQRGTGSLAAGLIAAAVVACQFSFVFWGAYVLPDTLLLFVLALCADRLLAVAEAPSPLIHMALAMTAALALAVTRQLAAPFLLVIPAFAVTTLRSDPRRLRLAMAGLIVPVLVGAGLVLPAIGTEERVTSLGDRARLVLWQGVYMSMQWTEQGRGTYGVDIDIPAVYDVREAAEMFRTSALDWMAADPNRFGSQTARRFRTFWSPSLPEYSPIHKLQSSLSYGALYGSALLGLIFGRKRDPLVVLSLFGIAVFSLAPILTIVDYDLRYRLPVELLLVPLSARGILWLAGRLPRRLLGVAKRRTEVLMAGPS